MFTLPTWALTALEVVGPLLKKHWKFFAGVLAGFLLCGYFSQPVEPTKTTETNTAENSSAASSISKTAKAVVDTKITTETFRPGGEVEMRTITETKSRTESLESAAHLSATARTVDVRIVEKYVPAPRMAGLGASWIPENSAWALSGDVEIARFGPYRLDAGFISPVDDLKRTAVRASVQFPLPF